MNVIGFHSVNGYSVLSFPDKTNRITFCLHLIEIRAKNMSNSDIQKMLYGLLETDEINEEFIKEEFYNLNIIINIDIDNPAPA